jgi:hypothetical protein
MAHLQDTQRRRMSRAEYQQRRTEFQPRGQDLPQSKLLDLQVIDIRSAKRQREALLKHIRDNLSNAALCKRYGIHIRTLEKIITRETWSHLP